MAAASAVVETFRRFDADNNGIIDRSDLLRVLTALNQSSFDETTVDEMLSLMDKNGDGRIQYAEFVEWVMGSGPTRSGPSRNDFSFDTKAFLPSRFEVAIENRYRLDKLAVGEGGYGKVFLAWDSKSGRQVAVKQVTKKDADPEATKSFYKEINLMKELDHPNICKLLETFERGHHIFFVMECCEGGEVFDRIIASGSISEAITANIIKQLVEAVRYAHGKKICHRDLKPENMVFLTKDPNDNRIKLIDWGLAMSFDGTLMKSCVGSATYTAPEVMGLMSELTPYTEACDLWSLGVVSYVMLAGKPPFWGSKDNHLRNARAERYPMDYAPWPSVSAEAKDFIAKLLKADPASRMSIVDCSQHTWLSENVYTTDFEAQKQVIQNMKRFTNTGLFTAMCITSVARQLDHKRLQPIHGVFRSMDKNGDGYLSIDEIREGFKQIHGESSAEYAEIERTFKGLDLDGSGIIDYTEFCAAGMGQHMATQEESIWAAFKSFDVDDTETISRAELEKVLANADVKKAWTPKVCEQVATKMLGKYDKDGDGAINFNEWMSLMRQVWAENLPGDQCTNANAAPLDSSTSWVYDLLVKVSELPSSAA